MNDTTGVGYMSSLMAFLVVFRFVNMYQRVISARAQVGHAETALRRICVLLHGMVHPPERWAEQRCVESRQRLATMAKLAFGTFCLAVNDSEDKSGTMTEDIADSILERVVTQYVGTKTDLNLDGQSLKLVGGDKIFCEDLKKYIHKLDTVEDMRAAHRSKSGLDVDAENLLTADVLEKLAEKADKFHQYYAGACSDKLLDDVVCMARDRELANKAKKKEDAAAGAEGEASDTKANTKAFLDEARGAWMAEAKRSAKPNAKAWMDEANRLRSKAQDKRNEQARQEHEKSRAAAKLKAGEPERVIKKGSSPYVKYKHKLRSLYMYACVQMLTTIEEMATGGEIKLDASGEKVKDEFTRTYVLESKPLIRNSPAQYGQLVVEIRGLMGGLFGTEQSIDLFRDRNETKVSRACLV